MNISVCPIHDNEMGESIMILYLTEQEGFCSFNQSSTF